MFDFNIGEIALLVMLAIIVFGPEKLPDLARKAARIIAYLRAVGNDARGQIRKELGPEWDHIDITDLNPRTFVQRHLLSGDEIEDLRAIREDALEAGTLLKDTANEATGSSRKSGRSASAAKAGTASAGASTGGGATAAVLDDPDDHGGGDPAIASPRAVAFDPEAT
ncbi:sec-independent translocase [Propioniciclava soli]|uniref:Sec-independent translocase n=1 Tax=Propioniciclava soli TaxID=2775081 RepID=A0ABZ3C4R2_9ACTN|nr:sec-independent translocase [Propioniciclava soli]